MNNSLYTLTILVVLLSCHSEEKGNSNGAENLTEIEFRLKGFNPAMHKAFIDLTIENALKPIHQQLKVSDSGYVSYSFINSRKVELVFRYDNRSLSLIASPGEKIGGYLNVGSLIDGSGPVEGKITGQNQLTNSLIVANTFYLDSLVETSSSFAARDGSEPDLDYKVLRVREMEDQLSDFKRLVTEHNINDEQFIDWATSRIRYRAGSDMSSYPYFGPTNRKLYIWDEYFSFRKEVEPDTDHEVVYQDYLEYLNNVATSLFIMSNVCDQFEEERKLLRRDSISNFPILFNLVKNLPDDKERELIMGFAFQQARKIPDNYYDSLKLFVSDRLISQLNEVEGRERKPIAVLLEEYDIPRQEKAGLIQLYRETQGKVVFHDFWFASCAPCVRELPNYDDLMKAVGPDVVFIFYGAYMSENEWKGAIEKFNLKGRHHLLTRNQIAFFEKYFHLYGFPHHQIINSKGQIADEEIPRVMPDNFERIKSLITKNKI